MKVLKTSQGMSLQRVMAVGAFALLAQAAMPAFAANDVVVAVASTFTSLDPYDSNDTLSQAVSKSFYQGLFGFDKDMKVINVLAEGYDVSKDGLEYTVRLRKGVKFHDGTDFKADAVKAAFDRVTNPDNKLKRYVLFNRIAKTEVVDDYTAKITLKEPFSPFINTLAHPSAAMISPAAIKQWGKDLGFHPVGTGPFQFVEWKQTDYMKVKKFDNYWRKGWPKVDTITWKPVVDNNTRSAMMQTGEAQFTFPVPYEQAELLKSKGNIELTAAPSIVHRYLSMNTMQKPFDNLKVRQAINYAINKDALVKVAFSGYAIPAEGPVPQGVEYAVKMKPWPYDPAKARELLKEAGYPNGFETDLWSGYNNTTAQKVIQFVQQQLAQVGIKTRLQALEAGQRVEKVESVQNPESAGVRLYYIGWSSSTGETDWALRPLLASESFPPKMLNSAYYKNPKVDQALADALKTTDRTKKAALYKEAQEEIWKDAPWAFLVTEKLLSAHSKNLSGFYVMPDASFSFEEMTLK
jgi:glutathione transport system substrate-binding protein